MSKEDKEDKHLKEEKKQEALNLILKMKTLSAHQALLDKQKREFLEELGIFVKKHNSIPRELVGAQDKFFPGTGENPRYSKSLSALK